MPGISSLRGQGHFDFAKSQVCGKRWVETRAPGAMVNVSFIGLCIVPEILVSCLISLLIVFPSFFICSILQWARAQLHTIFWRSLNEFIKTIISPSLAVGFPTPLLPGYCAPYPIRQKVAGRLWSRHWPSWPSCFKGRHFQAKRFPRWTYRRHCRIVW